jgi:cytochrome b561
MLLSVDTYFEKSMCLHWRVALFECVLFNKAVAEKTLFHHLLARTHFSSGFICIVICSALMKPQC